MAATITYTLGKFVWRELFTRDVEACKRFYPALFGWTFEDRPMGPDWTYTIWKNGDVEIGGMMDIDHIPNNAYVPAHWAVYVSVADVDAAAAKAEALGGKVMNPCMDIPNVGRFAVVADPQGAHFNLFRSAHGDPEDREPRPGEFCWENLATTDAAAALPFYQQVVGWTSHTMPGSGGPTTLFSRQAAQGAKDVASVGPAENAPSHWAPFVAVQDVAASAARCKALGGEVYLERTEIPDVGAFAVVADPTGSMFFVFERNA